MAASARRSVVTNARKSRVPVPIDASWNLTFDEEFGGALDTSTKWNITNPYGATTTSAGQPWDQDEILSANVSVSGGIGSLAVTKPAGGTVGGKTYGAASITTKLSQTYGYFETRCRMPTPTQNTNVLRNASVTGSVNGQPGTLPTFWGIGGGSGLRRTIVGAGTDSHGWKYVDIRIEGTTTDTAINIIMDDVTGASTGAPVTVAAYTLTSRISVTQGSMYNISAIGMRVTGYQSDGVTSTGTQTVGTDVTFLTSSNVLLGGNVTFASATARAEPYITLTYASGKNFSITLRISNPQLGLAATINGYYNAIWLVENASGPRQMYAMDYYGNVPATRKQTNLRSNSTSVSRSSIGDWQADYHVYGLLWTASSVSFYVDGTQVMVTTTDLPTGPCALTITNATAGSTWNIGGNFVDATTQFPNSLLIDYVHIYSTSGSAVAPDAGYGGPGANG